MRTALVVFGVGLLGLQACQSSGGDAAPSANIDETIAVTEPTIEDAGFEIGAGEPLAETVAMPLFLAQEFDSTIAYLLAAFDANGDEAVSRDEYDRGDSSWNRLDRNKDGVIDAADFESSARGGGGRVNFGTKFMISKYFQVDDEYDKVYLHEVHAAFAVYDTDKNDKIEVDEFTCAYEQVGVPVPGEDMYASFFQDTSPWEAILAGADENQDGALAGIELETFFLALAPNGSDVWIAEAPRERRRGPGRGSASGPRVEAQDGAMEGALAPDFTLSSPDGLDTVTLSSFAGSQPVALIFGSYT